MRALLSVSNKTGLVPFASALAARGVELVSTGGTAKALAGAGLPVVGISDVTGMPEMMDGRVKTLHPRVHAGILARRHRADDRAALAEHGITPIDLVVVNLYPFAQAAAKPDLPFDELVEEIDIGGPSLLRAAAKNFHDVLVVVEPEDYDRVIAALAERVGPESRAAVRSGAARVRAHGGLRSDDRVDARWCARRRRGGFTREPAAVWRSAAGRLGAASPQAARPAVRREPASGGRRGTRRTVRAPGFGGAVVHQGKELSFTNLLDLDAAARIALEFDGAGGGRDQAHESLRRRHGRVGGRGVRARARGRSAVGVRRHRRAQPADRSRDREGADVDVHRGGRRARPCGTTRCARCWGRRRTCGSSRRRSIGLGGDPDVRSILGGWLAQTRDRVEEAARPWPAGAVPRVVTKRAPTAEEWQALRFAWRVCAHVKSNAVIFTGPDVTLAIGAGQMSRVDAVKAAVMKGGERLRGAVAASDAFFPFRDGLDAIAAAGATAIVQPGGSVRDAEVIAAADEHGLAMVFTGVRHFRH